jgi:site-specific DNA recombinase
LVKKAFELYETGQHSKHEVLRMVTHLGLVTRKGKKVTAQTFSKMLRNRLYAGWISVTRWGDAKRGNFEPLVSQEVFERVQMILDGKRISLTPHVRNHPDFPLRRFVRCGKCGNSLTGSWSKGRAKPYPYYRCPSSKCRGVNVRKEKMETEFRLLLETLRPRSEYLRLFTAVVLDVWKARQADALLQRTVLENQLEKYKERKEQVIEAFVYRKAIDQAIYQEELDKLKGEMTLTEIHLNEVRLEELDVEAALNFSQYVFLNADRLWSEASLDQKQRLQGLLFPGGVTFWEGTFGTTKTCIAFNHLQTSIPSTDALVSPTAFEPVLLP